LTYPTFALRELARTTSSPSVDRATSTTALRRTRRRSGTVVSSRKRRAARLGRPAFETAEGVRLDVLGP